MQGYVSYACLGETVGQAALTKTPLASLAQWQSSDLVNRLLEFDSPKRLQRTEDCPPSGSVSTHVSRVGQESSEKPPASRAPRWVASFVTSEETVRLRCPAPSPGMRT